MNDEGPGVDHALRLERQEFESLRVVRDDGVDVQPLDPRIWSERYPKALSQCQKDLKGRVMSDTRLAEKMGWDEYLAAAGLNPSLIKIGTKSMKALKWAMDNPQVDGKAAFVFGHAVHTAVFEGRELENRFIVFDGRRDKRTDAYQDVLRLAEGTDCEIIKSSELAEAVEMGLAVAFDPLVKPLIASGQAEVSLFAEEHGQKCKGRLDWVCSDRGFADLKTCRDIRSYAFGKAFFDYGYDVSLGLYQRWLSRIRGQDEPCTVICVEKTPPYDVAVVPVPQAVLDRGADKGLRVIEQVVECNESGVWPGVADGHEYELLVPYHEMANGEAEMDWSRNDH